MGNLIPGFALGEDDPVGADLGQDLAVDFGFRLGDDPGDANSLQDERAANALLDVLTLANDCDLGTIDPKRQQRLLIRSIGLGGKRGVIGRLGDATLSDINCSNFVAKLVANAGDTAAEPSEPDDGNPLTR
jgi:hypothetical protein